MSVESPGLQTRTQRSSRSRWTTRLMAGTQRKSTRHTHICRWLRSMRRCLTTTITKPSLMGKCSSNWRTTAGCATRLPVNLHKQLCEPGSAAGERRALLGHAQGWSPCRLRQPRSIPADTVMPSLRPALHCRPTLARPQSWYLRSRNSSNLCQAGVLRNAD